MNNRPFLKWNAVAGVTKYTVRLKNTSLTLDWERETDKIQLNYPSEEQPLKAGFEYLLIVKTNTGKSSQDEHGNNLYFTLLDSQKAELVRTEIEKLKRLKLSPEIENLAIVELYQNYNLKAEAIELLEELVKRGSKSVAVYQFLGDLYLQLGLSQQATNPYLQALKLAEKTENIERQAEAQMGLGEAYYSLGNKDKAVDLLTQAKMRYTDLGDKSKIEELEKRINSL